MYEGEEGGGGGVSVKVRLNSLLVRLIVSTLTFMRGFLLFTDVKVIKDARAKMIYSDKLRHGPPVISPKSYGDGLSPDALVMRPQYFKRLNSLQMWSFRQQ